MAQIGVSNHPHIPMKPTVVPHEINFVLDTQQRNPMLANPKMLHYSGIVPENWVFLHPPMFCNNLVRMTFANGTGIVAQPNQIVFQEIINQKPSSAVEIADIASKYVKTMPNLGYQRMLITIIGHVPYLNEPVAPLQYLHDKLLAPGEWMEFGEAAVESSVTFRYQLLSSNLQLTVNHGTLRTPDEDIIPIVAFLAEFNHTINTDSTEETVADIIQAINTWQFNLKIYTDLINNKFLASQSPKTRGFSLNRN